MKKKENGMIHIVHHVDTEGPLNEPISELFKRLEDILGIDLKIKPSLKNLSHLQNGEIPFDKEVLETIKKITRPELITFKNNWDKIDEMLKRITSNKFRKKYKDSFDNGWVYNWHIMDHVGFETNERGRDLGYLKIFNHYENFFKDHNKGNDDIQWHFHPISFKKEAHKCATSYENSYYELHQSLCRRIIEKKFFPQVNRAGFHTVRPDSNWFLEQWMPFDASNQATINFQNESSQTDSINGRFGDWIGAKNDWDIYNPDLYDWRKEGKLKRYISKTLNLNTRFRNINEAEIEMAFLKAEKGSDVYLGITNHDFREMSNEINDFYSSFINVGKKFTKVKFLNSNTVNAFRAVIGYDKKSIDENAIDFKITLENNVLKIIITNGEPFGSQPYLAIKTKNSKYFHDNLDFGVFKKEDYYTFDSHTLNIDEISEVGVASNDKYGNCKIKTINIENN